MSGRTAADAFASATSALVTQTDTAGILADLLADATEVLGVDCIGLLMRSVRGNDRLELLGASSHAAVELELFQLQHEIGPCLEVITEGRALVVSTGSRLEQRWDPVGPAIVAAGFAMVQAYPLRWRGVVLGALNAFSRHAGEEVLDPRGQTFADIATLVVTQPRVVTEGELGHRVQSALQGRIIIERAKGVLAYSRDVDVATAYELLRRRAADNGLTLSEAADRVLTQAQRL